MAGPGLSTKPGAAAAEAYGQVGCTIRHRVVLAASMGLLLLGHSQTQQPIAFF